MLEIEQDEKKKFECQNQTQNRKMNKGSGSGDRTENIPSSGIMMRAGQNTPAKKRAFSQVDNGTISSSSSNSIRAPMFPKQSSSKALNIISPQQNQNMNEKTPSKSRTGNAKTPEKVYNSEEDGVDNDWCLYTRVAQDCSNEGLLRLLANGPGNVLLLWDELKVYCY